MITLYQRTDCPFCWKVRLALAELAADYQSIDMVLGEKHPEVMRLSPTGSVPVLVEEGVAIWESAVVLDYLHSRNPDSQLYPSDPAGSAAVRLLHAFSDKLVGASLRDIVFEKRSRPERDWDRDTIERGERAWQDCLAWLESELGSAVFFGEGFSAADCALASRFGVAEAYGAAVTEQYPGLFSWFQAAKKRPSWRAAYPTSFIRSD